MYATKIARFENEINGTYEKIGEFSGRVDLKVLVHSILESFSPSFGEDVEVDRVGDDAQQAYHWKHISPNYLLFKKNIEHVFVSVFLEDIFFCL